MADSEEEKQNYLRENILDKGYEAEDFVTYLTSKKGDEGVDLGNWSLNELKLVVQEYILTHPKGKIQPINNFQAAPQLQNNFHQNNPLQNPIMNNNMNNFNNMSMGMNNNMNMGMNTNMSMGMNINNNNLNNFNNQQIQSNLNQNYMPYIQDNNLNTESDVQTDIYGITNLETILCSVNEKSELCRYQNIQIEISLGEKLLENYLLKLI